MATFQPLNTKKYQKSGKVITPDTVYWQRLSVPTLVKEFGAIDYIDFSPSEPYCFAVTCSVRVQIYNPITKLVVKNLSRFQETAYGGSFRQDGRLLVAGDEQGLVKLFDTSSKNVLRLLKGHKAPVHRTYFTSDLLRIASFSDDQSVKLWDIANERVIHTYTEHNDYVRAGAVSPVTSNVLLSGGYDGKIKLYDTRTKQLSASIDHGSPVESLLFLPSGGIFVSAGGTEVRVWDAFAGCRLLTKLSQHHKEVTCLRLGSNGKRILSGGLDRHVKIYDVGTYQTVHTLNFPNAVLSLGVAPNDQVVVAGMVDGLVSIQNMNSSKSAIQQQSHAKTKKAYWMKAQRDEIDISTKRIQVDHEIKGTKVQPKLAAYDKFFRRYEYQKALDAVLNNKIVNKQPEVTVTVLQELIHRKGLRRALEHRSHASLSIIIRFISRYIGEHRFMRVLIDVANTLLDLYESNFHEFTGTLGKDFIQLSNLLQQEVVLTYELLELQGALELLIDVAANVGSQQVEMVHFVSENSTSMKQSLLAKDASVLVV